MTNFETVLAHLNTAVTADETIILGDALYTEAKDLGDLFRKLQTADLTKKESPQAPGTKSFSIYQEYLRRFNCGWVKIGGLIHATGNKDFIKLKTAMIPGNHSFDVNAEKEAFFLSNYMPAFSKAIIGGKLDNQPTTNHDARIVLANAGKLLYLDIDMTLLNCSVMLEAPNTIVNWKACATENRFVNYPDLETEVGQTAIYNKCKAYYDNLKLLLAQIPLQVGVKWRIARVHQPIFNTEQDFWGVKSNSVLMNLFKIAHIHLWLVSHHHTAEIGIAKYTSVTAKKEFNAAEIKEPLNGLNVKTVNNCNSILKSGCGTTNTGTVYVKKKQRGLCHPNTNRT